MRAATFWTDGRAHHADLIACGETLARLHMTAPSRRRNPEAPTSGDRRPRLQQTTIKAHTPRRRTRSRVSLLVQSMFAIVLYRQVCNLAADLADFVWVMRTEWSRWKVSSVSAGSNNLLVAGECCAGSSRSSTWRRAHRSPRPYRLPQFQPINAQSQTCTSTDECC